MYRRQLEGHRAARLVGEGYYLSTLIVKNVVTTALGRGVCCQLVSRQYERPMIGFAVLCTTSKSANRNRSFRVVAFSIIGRFAVSDSRSYGCT